MERQKYPCSIEALWELRVLLDDMIEQMQKEALAAAKPAELALLCSADRMLVGMGEELTLSGVVKNTSQADAGELWLAFTLPAGLRLVPGSVSCDCESAKADCPGAIRLPGLAAGESCIIRFQARVDQLPGENPVQVGFRCQQGGRSIEADSLCIWITDRSCCRKSVGCCMADVLAQWSLAQLFGLDDCEIALLLEYLQNHREDILSITGGCR